MIQSEQLKEISVRLDNLQKYLQIEQKRIEIANEEEKTFAPDFWDDAKEAQKIIQKIQSQKNG